MSEFNNFECFIELHIWDANTLTVLLRVCQDRDEAENENDEENFIVSLVGATINQTQQSLSVNDIK